MNVFPPLDGPWPQSISYDTRNGPPIVNLQDQGQLNIAFAGLAGSNYKRRKTPRTSQACDACRAAKVRCDDPKPCSSCKEKDIECAWKIPEPKHGSKLQVKILETLKTVSQQQQVILKKIETMKLRDIGRQQAKLKQAIIKLKPELEADLMFDEGDYQDVEGEDRFANLNGPAISRHVSIPDNAYQQIGFGYGQDSPDLKVSAEEEEEEAGKQLLPGNLSIPVGHTTGAARLLLWPAVESFLAEKLKNKKKLLQVLVEYPNIQENRHGIRLYGRGPGSSRSQSSEGLPLGTFSGISASPSPPSYPGHYGISTYRQPEERRGGLDEDGQLELDKHTVFRLVDSYLKCMHIMHPILNPAELRAYAKRFVETLPQAMLMKAKGRTQPMEPSLGFVSNGAETSGGKRKWSPVASLEQIDMIPPYPFKPGRPQRSIKNAVLLLVLALGKIFEHRDKIPDILPEYKSSSGESPHARSGFSSPMPTSPLVSNQSSVLPSPHENNQSGQPMGWTSTKNSISPQAMLLSSNLDVIPGLAYAAFATDILGNEIGGSTLHHVHANILASLYFGQLARPAYSHQLILNASTKLQIILRMKLERLRKYKPDPNNLSMGLQKVPSKDNPIIFAFWTCLQLESDIIAELDLPHSGITTLEMYMPWPNLEAAKEDKILNAVQAESYQAQLYLRNHLNVIQQRVYGVGEMGKSLEENYKLPITNEKIQLSIIEAMVDAIPNMKAVAPSMVWKDDDPPADKILSARLRAKYYGIEVITYRPFLKMVLNRPSRIAQGFRNNHSAIPEDRIPKRILDYAKLCIRAMENSTRAFHGIECGRLIVTNVWGTAHAQWGNVILLQAAYQDPILQHYINKENLRHLVIKTLKFLSDVADPASALMTDIEILKFAAWKMGFISSPQSIK